MELKKINYKLNKIKWFLNDIKNTNMIKISNWFDNKVKFPKKKLNFIKFNNWFKINNLFNQKEVNKFIILQSKIDNLSGNLLSRVSKLKKLILKFKNKKIKILNKNLKLQQNIKKIFILQNFNNISKIKKIFQNYTKIIDITAWNYFKYYLIIAKIPFYNLFRWFSKILRRRFGQTNIAFLKFFMRFIIMFNLKIFSRNWNIKYFLKRFKNFILENWLKISNKFMIQNEFKMQNLQKNRFRVNNLIQNYFIQTFNEIKMQLNYKLFIFIGLHNSVFSNFFNFYLKKRKFELVNKINFDWFINLKKNLNYKFEKFINLTQLKYIKFVLKKLKINKKINLIVFILQNLSINSTVKKNFRQYIWYLVNTVFEIVLHKIYFVHLAIACIQKRIKASYYKQSVNVKFLKLEYYSEFYERFLQFTKSEYYYVGMNFIFKIGLEYIKEGYYFDKKKNWCFFKEYVVIKILKMFEWFYFDSSQSPANVLYDMAFLKILITFDKNVYFMYPYYVE